MQFRQLLHQCQPDPQPSGLSCRARIGLPEHIEYVGQKVRPTGFRVGITDDWRSRWYAKKKDFGTLLVEDQKIREFVKREYGFAGIPRVDLERKTEGGEVTVKVPSALTPLSVAARTV